MKIIVQGDIVDTENICYITDIEYDRDIYYWVFRIIFFNNIKLIVSNGAPPETWKIIMSKEQKEKAKEIAKNKLIDLRNRIIKVWSENKTKLETFNIIE